MFENFISWLDNNDILYHDFLQMKEVVIKYVEMFYNSTVKKEAIYSNLDNVLKKCGEIRFDDYGQTGAYIVVHFLDRYHRFQITFYNMFQNGTFPVNEKFDFMDIGTGPGPAIWAASDMLLNYQLFTQSHPDATNIIKEVNLDYVERSQGFRDFLHHGAEIAMQLFHKKPYVPFHFGTYDDALDLSFSGLRKDGNQLRFAKRSFNMVIYSNFLTTVDSVNLFSRQIKNSSFYLRNKGVLLISGGSPEDKKYSAIYKSIKSLVQKQKFTNHSFYGKCTALEPVKMYYGAEDKCTSSLKEYYNLILNYLSDNDKNKLPLYFRQIIDKYLQGNEENSWWITIYQRHSAHIDSTAMM